MSIVFRYLLIFGLSGLCTFSPAAMAHELASDLAASVDNYLIKNLGLSRSESPAVVYLDRDTFMGLMFSESAEGNSISAVQAWFHPVDETIYVDIETLNLIAIQYGYDLDNLVASVLVHEYVHVAQWIAGQRFEHGKGNKLEQAVTEAEARYHQFQFESTNPFFSRKTFWFDITQNISSVYAVADTPTEGLTHHFNALKANYITDVVRSVVFEKSECKRPNLSMIKHFTEQPQSNEKLALLKCDLNLVESDPMTTLENFSFVPPETLASLINEDTTYSGHSAKCTDSNNWYLSFLIDNTNTIPKDFSLLEKYEGVFNQANRLSGQEFIKTSTTHSEGFPETCVQLSIGEIKSNTCLSQGKNRLQIIFTNQMPHHTKS